MSEEKLYAVRNDEGLLLSYSEQGAPLWRVWGEMLADKPTAKITALAENGHIVTLIEEPEKVVLTKEQAEIVEGARNGKYPTTYISNRTDDEELLMNAYINGYTVAKEKKYVVYKELGGKHDKDNPMEYAQACRALSNSETMFWVLTTWIINDKGAKFTEKEISDYGLQDCEKEEVTDDEQ